jgi:hypothetical protein
MSLIAMHRQLKRVRDADDGDDGSVAFRLDCLDYTHKCVCVYNIHIYVSVTPYDHKKATHL